LTIHISKRTLTVVGVIAAVVVAFLIGRAMSNSEGGPSDKTDETAASTSVASDGPDCENQAAWEPVEQALLADGDESEQLIPPGTQSLRRDIIFKVVGCQDLTGDGQDEMVVTADGAVAGFAHSVTWFILKAEGDEWKSVSHRTQPVPELELLADGVQETTPTFGNRDPMCCPSSTRVGVVKFIDGKFVYEPSSGSLERKITLGPDKRIKDLGPLDVTSATSDDAIDQFGITSSTGTGEEESCPMYWSDLGLTINMVNLGGFDSCRRGAVQSVEIERLAARQAGWSGPNGIQLGDTLADARSVFPGIRRAPQYSYEDPEAPPMSNPWTLVQSPSPYTGSGATPSVTGYFLRDDLRKLNFYLGAGGE
jgi:hypothetical protein